MLLIAACVAASAVNDLSYSAKRITAQAANSADWIQISPLLARDDIGRITVTISGRFAGRVRWRDVEISLQRSCRVFVCRVAVPVGFNLCFRLLHSPFLWWR